MRGAGAAFAADGIVRLPQPEPRGPVTSAMHPYLSRREALKLGAALPFALALPAFGLGPSAAGAEEQHFLTVRDKVPDPENLFFEVTLPGKAPIRLAGHFWYNAETAKAGIKCPAIVEFNPYRRRDGTMIGDAKMYPWFAYHDYLCFRVDLPGS